MLLNFFQVDKKLLRLFSSMNLCKLVPKLINFALLWLLFSLYLFYQYFTAHLFPSMRYYTSTDCGLFYYLYQTPHLFYCSPPPKKRIECSWFWSIKIFNNDNTMYKKLESKQTIIIYFIELINTYNVIHVYIICMYMYMYIHFLIAYKTRVFPNS